MGEGFMKCVLAIEKKIKKLDVAGVNRNSLCVAEDEKRELTTPNVKDLEGQFGKSVSTCCNQADCLNLLPAPSPLNSTFPVQYK